MSWPHAAAIRQGLSLGLMSLMGSPGGPSTQASTPLLPLHTCPSLSHLWTEKEQQDWLLTGSGLGTLGGDRTAQQETAKSGQFGVRLGYAV